MYNCFEQLLSEGNMLYTVLAYSYEVDLYGRGCFKAPPTIDTDYSWL